MDLILGTFADATIDSLDAEELDEFERLIEIDDRDLYKWITGEVATPETFDTALFRRIRAHSQDDLGC